MRTKRGELVVFSISALDLFASSLGAFILIVIILFPYYLKDSKASGGLDFSETMKQRAKNIQAAMSQEITNQQKRAELKAMEGDVGELMSEVKSLNEQLFGKKRAAENMAEQAAKLQAEQEAKDKQQVTKAVVNGIEFSILGINTNAKSFAIVVDLSGSMSAYSDLLINSLDEILSIMKPTNQFAILGFSDSGRGRLERYPGGRALELASPSNIGKAKRFIRTLPSRFGGTTPTGYAMISAMEYDVEAIVLLSDGDPTDMSGAEIVADLRSRNRRKGLEIHTVAIGDYTSQPKLIRFLQQLAKTNRGNFVGVSP